MSYLVPSNCLGTHSNKLEPLNYTGGTASNKVLLARDKEQFISHMLHEILSPLTPGATFTLGATKNLRSEQPRCKPHRLVNTCVVHAPEGSIKYRSPLPSLTPIYPLISTNFGYGRRAAEARSVPDPQGSAAIGIAPGGGAGVFYTSNLFLQLLKTPQRCLRSVCVSVASLQEKVDRLGSLVQIFGRGACKQSDKIQPISSSVRYTSYL